MANLDNSDFDPEDQYEDRYQLDAFEEVAEAMSEYLLKDRGTLHLSLHLIVDTIKIPKDLQNKGAVRSKVAIQGWCDGIDQDAKKLLNQKLKDIIQITFNEVKHIDHKEDIFDNMKDLKKDMDDEGGINDGPFIPAP